MKLSKLKPKKGEKPEIKNSIELYNLNADVLASLSAILQELAANGLTPDKDTMDCYLKLSNQNMRLLNTIRMERKAQSKAEQAEKVTMQSATADVLERLSNYQG